MPASASDEGTIGPFEVPQFSHGGVLVNLQYGAGFWNLDRDNITATTFGQGQSLLAQVQNTHTLDIALAYNILGHASIGVAFTATGWNVFDPTRGGSGYLVGQIAWHPLELVFIQKKRRPLGLDISTSVGLGYGIVGVSGGGGVNAAAGMDGLVVQWGLQVDYFFTRFIGLGFFARGNFLRFATYYYNWDAAHSGDNTAQSNFNPVSNGSFWNLGIDLVFRVGD